MPRLSRSAPKTDSTNRKQTFLTEKGRTALPNYLFPSPCTDTRGALLDSNRDLLSALFGIPGPLSLSIQGPPPYAPNDLHIPATGGGGWVQGPGKREGRRCRCACRGPETLNRATVWGKGSGHLGAQGFVRFLGEPLALKTGPLAVGCLCGNQSVGRGCHNRVFPGTAVGCRASPTALSPRKDGVPRQTFFGEPFQTILRKEAISDHALPPEA